LKRRSGYMPRISTSSITTIGAVISAAMYSWLTLGWTFAQRSTMAYINRYIARNDSTAIASSRR